MFKLHLTDMSDVMNEMYISELLEDIEINLNLYMVFKDVAKTHTIPIGDDFVRIEDFDINQLCRLEDIKNVWFWLDKVVEYNISDEIINDFKVNHRELLKNRILLKAMLSEIRK